MSVQDVAEILNVSDDTVRALVAQKRLRAVNVGSAVDPRGRRYRIAPVDLAAFVKASVT